MTSVEERRRLLESDSDISIVEPHRVYCLRCDKWLKLDESKFYSTSVWRAHKATKTHNWRSPVTSAQSASQTPDPSQNPTNASSQSDVSVSENTSIPVQKAKPSPIPVLPESQASGSSRPHTSASNPEAASSASVPIPRIKIKPKPKGSSGKTKKSQNKPVHPVVASLSAGGPPILLLSPQRQRAESEAQQLRLAASRTESAQGSMPPPTAEGSSATSGLAPPRSSFFPDQSAEGSTQMHSTAPAHVRSDSSSKNPLEAPATGSGDLRACPSVAGTTATAIPTPEHLSPERKPSYKALMREPCIGKLEPFRAFCTLCNRWVELSSRTPYSYGVWKGHVRKSSRHSKQAQLVVAEEYHTASDHSHEETSTTVPRRNRRGGIHTAAPPADQAVALSNEDAEKGESFYQVPTESKPSDCSDAVSANVPQTMNMPPPADTTPEYNPFTLKATTQDSFGRRRYDSYAEGDISTAENIEGVMESSDEDIPKRSPHKRSEASLAALERRRQVMLEDEDACVVEPRRVKCRLCERWIKGSNTQEYSLHHWVKHKKKCTRNKRALEGDGVDPADNRKTNLETDPDIKALEPHRALCGICTKWVKLSGRIRYSSPHWQQHKKVCLPQNAYGQLPSTRRPTMGSFENTAEARYDALKLDPDIQQVWPDRVQCRGCEQIILMATYPPYMSDAWLKHKAHCTARDIAVKRRLENAPVVRKALLENDWHILTIEPHRAHCRVCNDFVKLDNDLPYSLYMWDIHRQDCGVPVKRTRRDPRTAATRVQEILLGDSEKASENGASMSQDYNVSEETKKDSVTNDERLITPHLNDCNGEDNGGDVIMVDGNGDAATKDVTGTPDSRLEYYLRQPEVFGVQRQRVLCGRCLRWVTLDGSEMLMTQSWDAHKGNCCGPATVPTQIAVADSTMEASALPAAARQPFTRRANAAARPVKPKGKGKAPVGTRPASPMLLPPLPPRPRWPGEDERKELFLSDPDIIKIEPHRLLCRICGCWIRLHPVVRYAQSIWPKHKVACKNVQLDANSRPGETHVKAKTEKEDLRRIALENDPYVGEIGPHRVSCQACGTSIRLDTTYRYEGSHWRAHKARCSQIPIHDRMTKKKKGSDERHGDQDSPSYLEPIAIADSSDSDDSDASSVPRPRPTAVFTAPLEIDLTKMFRPRPPLEDSPTVTDDAAAAAAAKVKREAELHERLEKLAEELNASDRVSEIINAVGDGITSEERLAEERRRAAEQDGDQSDDEPGGATGLLPLSPTPDPETWRPLKRKNEDTEFDAFFCKRPRPESPMPKGQRRVCALDKEAMQVID